MCLKTNVDADNVLFLLYLPPLFGDRGRGDQQFIEILIFAASERDKNRLQQADLSDTEYLFSKIEP